MVTRLTNNINIALISAGNHIQNISDINVRNPQSEKNVRPIGETLMTWYGQK